MSRTRIGSQKWVTRSQFADSEPDDESPLRMVGAGTSRTAIRSIQSVNLVEVFQERACVMKSVPRFLQGPHRLAIRVGT